MAHPLLVPYLVDGNEDARLLDVAETVVDGRSEELHRRREAHVGIDQRRDVVAQGTYLTVQDAVVFVEVAAGEKLLQLALVSFNFQRFHRNNQLFLVGKILLEEIENHVAATADIGRIHGELPEEVPYVRLDDGQRP